MRPALLAVALSLLPFTACGKPSDDDCRKAIVNLQRLRGQDQKPAADIEAFVRRCRSTGNSDNVRCLINARTAADADACTRAK
jgi:hypothetical protein